jgi:CHAT domain-containing protein
VPAPDSPRENLVALSGGHGGHPTYIGPEWIGAHRLPGSLVVMNGCRSGSGVVSAGEGLMGLTRAWLRAGASRVLSTYWPTLDDGGALVAEFYRQLTRDDVSTAEALRRAQASMIAHGDWRADPHYWAAYFLIGYPE